MAVRFKAFVEHLAILVRDIHSNTKFFHDVLGMEMREVQGVVEEPGQYRPLGGVTFITTPDAVGPEGRPAHLGVMCEDAEAALAAARTFDVTERPRGRNWLRRVIELIQTSPGAAAHALAINPRA